MSNTISMEESTIKLTYKREEDGSVAVTTVLLESGDAFTLSIDLQEAQERSRYINELCADKPGIGTAERRWIRSELQKIARATAIDLRFDTSGKINGRASCSARLWAGKKVIETSSLNLLSPEQRTKSIKHLAPFVAGKNASKRMIEQAERDLHRLFMAELQTVLTAAPKPPTHGQHSRDVIPYRMDDQGITWLTKTREGMSVERPLTNFGARIIAEVTRDDGSGELRREFELEVMTRSGKSSLILGAAEFQEMKWPGEKLGTRGHLWPGQGTKENARDAIVRLSGEPTDKHIHTCPGWIKVEGASVYLHGGGVIAANDSPPSIDVDLDAGLEHFVLPAPPTDARIRRDAIRASLNILTLAKNEIVVPVYCLIGRAPLGWSDFIVNLVGRTGTFKSELASLAQRHFGEAMHAKKLPGSWESTTNAKGELLFLLRDTLGVLDDFKLKGSPNDIMRLHAGADTVYRWQGNGVGKGRMNAAGGLRMPHPPRGTILSTSEHIPQGESCRGRGMHVPVSPGDIPGAALTDCQRDAEAGTYAIAMAAYIRWLAQEGRIDKIRGELPELIRKYRVKAQSSELHKRTPEIVANLYLGLRFWLQFCVDAGAITDEQCRGIKLVAWTALGNVAQAQLEHQASSEPVARYLELIMSALGSGKAHVAGADGCVPADEVAIACGWSRRSGFTGWEPRGSTCIGYITEEGVFLIPDAAYTAAQAAGGPGGSGLFEPEPELRKRLEEKGALASTDGGKFNRRTVRKSFAGMMRPVLWLRPGVLPLPCARSVRSDAQAEPETVFFDAPAGVNR